MSTAKVTLDSPVFSGRLRQFSRGTPFIHAPQARSVKPQAIEDVRIRPSKADQPQIENKIIQSRLATVPQAVNREVQKSQVLQRNTTYIPKTYSDTKTFKKAFENVGSIDSNKSLTQKLMLAMATVVFVAGLGVALLGLKTNHDVAAQARNGRNGDGSGAQAVSEEKPTNEQIANYQVDPASPRYVRIAKFGVYARVQKQGVLPSGALKAPYNVYDAGWYENSSKPGEGGAVLLDGHVAGPTTHGVFYDIKKLVAGDKVEVERGDGKKFTYQVVKSVTAKVSQVDMSSALLSVKEGKSGLNMITCTGTYDYQKGEYDSRIIVYAVQI